MTIEEKVEEGIDAAVKTTRGLGRMTMEQAHRAKEEAIRAAAKIGEKVKQAGQKVEETTKKA